MHVTEDENNLLIAIEGEGLFRDFDAEENQRLLKDIYRLYSSELPVTVRLGSGPGQDYVVHTSDGVVFEAYRILDQNKKPVLINDDVYWVKYCYKNEKRALRLQSRLIASDNKIKVLVSKKIQGSSLDDTIISLFKQNKEEECAKVLNKYIDLVSDFRQKYRLVHSDAHPENVIVDHNDDLHLIDFGLTKPLSKTKREAENQIVKDDLIVVNWVEWYMKLFEDLDDEVKSLIVNLLNGNHWPISINSG